MKFRGLKRIFLLLLAGLWLCGPVPAWAERTSAYTVDYQHLRVANPTPLTGHFFTSMWGASTSDLDVQELLHRYKLVVYDNELGRYRMNHLVVSGAVTQDDEEGNRTYFMALCDDLTYSDGSPISSRDYAFTLLLMMDPAVAEAGGIPMDQRWIRGAEEYLSGESSSVSGIRLLGDHLLSVTVRADALPYFYELSRFRISPYPMQVIAPDCELRDDGEGVYLTPGLTGDILRKTLLDSYTGYMTAPQVVSGPYTLESYRNGEAHFLLNPRYKGNQKGETPAIPELTYSGKTGEEMTEGLASGELGLLNKVMNAETVTACFRLMQEYPERYRMISYPRTGLTVLRFMPRSERVQETAVRQAMFYCLDRDGIVLDELGSFGMPVKGLYGVGQWMVRLIDEYANYPEIGNEEGLTPEEVLAYEKALEEWQNTNMSNIREYTLDVPEAIRLLEEGGWNLNSLGEPFESGVRYKRMEDGRLVGLKMTVMIPANHRESLEKNWKGYLEEAGIGLTLVDQDIWTLAETYRRDSIEDCDLVFVGENFTDRFRLNGGYRQFEENENPEDDTPLEDLDHELDVMSMEVYRTEQTDLESFARKWLRLQMRVAETVPVIPVYSNVYFDFFETTLHDYHVENYLGWGNAIVASWLGAAE